MCGIEQTRYDHWVTNRELDALAQRYPAAKRFLEGVAAFKDLRPPVALAALVAMQLQRLHEGRAMARSFLLAHYRYQGSDGRLRVIERRTTPFLDAVHDGFVGFHMSDAARLRLGCLAEGEGLFLAAEHCCGEIFETSLQGLTTVLLDPDRLAKEAARMRMHEDAFLRRSMDGVHAVPDSVITPLDRELHAEFERAMEWLCGPVSEADKPFTSDQHAPYAPLQMTV